MVHAAAAKRRPRKINAGPRAGPRSPSDARQICRVARLGRCSRNPLADGSRVKASAEWLGKTSTGRTVRPS